MKNNEITYGLPPNGNGFSGDYNDLTNKPIIPSTTEDLPDSEDKRYVTDEQKNNIHDPETQDNAIATKVTLAEVKTDADIADAINKKHNEVHNHDTTYEAKNTNIQGHIGSTSNPHSVTKAQVGLDNAENTSDANKPISSATQTALNGKASSSHSHSPSDVTGTAVITTDSRLSDARTPLAHSNHAISDVVNLQTSLNGKEPANANIQTHVTSQHAPSNAQKNSDITKVEIEAKLTGEITSHSHAGSGGGTIVFLGDI